MSYAKIRVEVEEGVARVTLADPATLNAASVDMLEELIDAFDRIASGDLGARTVPLTGEGRGFCSGANLADPRRPGGDVLGAALDSHFNPLVNRLRDLPVPLLTAVNGPAVGIGCAFALMGDLVLAAENAYFALSFRRIGLVPDGGSTWLLPRLIGKARAMEMALLGDRISPDVALDWGLINRVEADAQLIPAAMTLARNLASGAWSVAATRRLIWEGLERDWPGQLDAERRAQSEAGRTEDFREGVAAFLQKREPAFKGR